MSLSPGSRFSTLYRTGARTRRGGVLVIEGEGMGTDAEVGVVAGKRVGNAVRRNRAKRRLREAMGRLDLASDRAYVVVASPSVVDVGFDDLVAWCTKAVAGSKEGGT